MYKQFTNTTIFRSNFTILGPNCFFENTLYKGNDILGDCDLQPDKWKTDSAQECQFLCQDLEECKEFTWIAPGHEGTWRNGKNRCCLKTKLNENPITTKGRISGPKFCGILLSCR